MRILDKNKDFYDYLQTYDDILVYDRRSSYILTNQDICDLWYGFHEDFSDKYLLLQVGYSYWLMIAKCESTAVSITNSSECVDYSLELVDYWKDYNHFDSLHFGTVDKHFSAEFLFSKKWDWKSNLIDEIKRGNYEYKKDFTKSYPNLIFRNIKIPSVVMADDLYNAFDEYFAHLKDDVIYDSMSDIEKIESHGFDKKTSFRGK
jgi:hypothetical protein